MKKMSDNMLGYFSLESMKSFSKAEKFKSKLENAGYSVVTMPHGFNGVKIIGKRYR